MYNSSESKFQIFKDAKTLKMVLETIYKDMTEKEDEVDIGDAGKELLVATSLKLIDSLRKNEPNLDGIVDYLSTVKGDDIKDITELVLKITNYSYNNYGYNYIDDNLYDELSYLYKSKSNKIIFSAPLRKKSVEVQHSFPELKGTLEKVRYVLKVEATMAGKSYDDVESFLEKYEDTVFGKANPFMTVIPSLKYDGVSAVVKMEDGEITEVLTRGDNDKGADITRLFKDYKFPQIVEYVETRNPLKELPLLGIQCEVVFKKDKLEEFNTLFNKKYVNGRSAVVGITSAFDIQKRIEDKGINLEEYVTLMPLNITSPYLPTLGKREMMLAINNYLDMSTEWTTLSGMSAYEVLNKFTIYKDMVLAERDNLPYMIDGIVIEFDKPAVREEMGRYNNINNFAIAYKFPSQMKATKVVNVFFNVGRTGEVIPMVEYEPVYFNGGEFRKTSLSNITNFKLMNLKEGDIIDVQYSNDVLCYVTKNPRREENINNKNKPYEVPTVCPFCGQPLSLLSEEGLKLYCTNLDCPSRIVENMANFFDKLSIKDLGRETIQFLYDKKYISNLPDLLTFKADVLAGVEGFCAKKIAIIQDALDKVFENTYKDYEILGALGFRSAASTTFRPICRRINFKPIIETGTLPNSFIHDMMSLKGFGEKKAKTIRTEMGNILFKQPRLLKIISCLNIDYTYADSIEDDMEDGFKVCFTNVRDEELENEITKRGGYVVPSVTKATNLLVTKDGVTNSTKVTKAKKYGIPIIAYTDFKQNYKTILAKLAKEFQR